ncbi:hypothetical protein [Streptomyces sp. NBC_01264]|uniref:hypothetical protein n=1 Tax=Streptomyces sp. NBC_01264 TaxID=2903804 RepID=UPI00224CBD85|nr:hypothetical protein [Streptomyces sp. NBC_01264]MCX4783836.1 hypothetical protein [Streptomyces sp. NBC_01264]
MLPARRRIRGAAAPLSTHYGDLVRVALMEARPAGLQTRQLVAATRLTPSQVARGVRHLRDVGAAEHLTPIIWRRKDGYLFSDEPADWIEYEKQQFRQILGRLTRMITGTLDPHLARYPEDEWAQLASAQLTGVRATLAQLTK